MSDLSHGFGEQRFLGEPAGSDIPRLNLYREAMERGLPYVRLTVDVREPIELGDFVGAFTALGAEYDRYTKVRDRSDTHGTLYVREVRPGSFIADLLPALAGMGSLANTMQQIMAVEDFVKRYGTRLLAYASPNGRAEDVTKAELEDFLRQTAVISHHPGSTLEIAAIEIENGDHKVRAAFQFDTKQARAIQDQVELHRYEIEHQRGKVYERALMIFTRSDVRSTALGKRSGEQVRIEDISHRSMPIIYQSDMAEEQIKHEIKDADDNVYKKGFIVDVGVEERQGRVIAYRILNLHQVIDLPDDDEDDGADRPLLV